MQHFSTDDHDTFVSKHFSGSVLDECILGMIFARRRILSFASAKYALDSELRLIEF